MSIIDIQDHQSKKIINVLDDHDKMIMNPPKPPSTFIDIVNPGNQVLPAAGVDESGSPISEHGPRGSYLHEYLLASMSLICY
jgi:hypothetical protein